MAAIIFPSIYHQQLPLDLIEKFLPNEVYKLAQGVKKMDAIQQILSPT